MQTSASYQLMRYCCPTLSTAGYHPEARQADQTPNFVGTSLATDVTPDAAFGFSGVSLALQMPVPLKLLLQLADRLWVVTVYIECCGVGQKTGDGLHHHQLTRR